MTLHRRTFRLLAVLLGALSLLLSTGVQPASASHDARYSHWGAYSWNGVKQIDGRSFYLYDRSSDPTVTAAVQEFVQAYNNDITRRGKYGIYPAIAYVRDTTSINVCGNVNWTGWSFMTLCSIEPGHMGVASVMPDGFHNENYQPYVLVRPGMSYDNAFTTVCAEVGHTFGLGHQPNDSGSCEVAASPGGKRYFNEHDFQELEAIYNPHRW